VPPQVSFPPRSTFLRCGFCSPICLSWRPSLLARLLSLLWWLPPLLW
jgi:hypothetical protein